MVKAHYNFRVVTNSGKKTDVSVPSYGGALSVERAWVVFNSWFDGYRRGRYSYRVACSKVDCAGSESVNLAYYPMAK